jgi:outer membrane autotransporter protein
MLDCRNRSSNERVVSEGTCIAGGVSGWKFDRDNDGSAGYELSSGQFSIGAERQLSPEWAIGGAIGYDRLRNRGDNGFWSGDANLYHAGVFVRRNFSELALTAAAIGGFSKPDMDRYPTPTTRAHGDQEMHWFGGTLRAEKPFAITHGTLRPMLDVNGLRVKSDGLTESGGLTALQVGSEHQTNWSVRPALEWSMEVARSDGSVLRPRVVVGVTQYLNDPSPALSASFLGIGAGVVAPMQVSSDVSKTYGDVLLGVDFQGKGNLTVGASLFGQFSSRSNQFGGGLQMKMAF